MFNLNQGFKLNKLPHSLCFFREELKYELYD